MYLNDIFTVTVNLAGLPAMSVPGGLDAQGPAAGPAADRPRRSTRATLFSLAGALEQAAEFAAKPERWW